MRHLPTARLVIYNFSTPDFQPAPQKAQEQENQLKNQLKQNYMQIVSSVTSPFRYCLLKPSFQSGYRKQLQELEVEKKSLTNKQQAAIDTAVAAVKSENPTTAVPTNEAAEKHAQELKALEERLRAEHKKELEATAANAVPGETGEKNKGTDIDTVISAAKAEWGKAHEEEIEKAIERGRVEQQTKGRLKDAQLMRTQAKVKELEAKVLELQGSGATSTSKITTPAPAQKPAPTQPPGQKPVPATNKPQPTATQNRLPNRPGVPPRGGGPGRILGGRGGAPTPQSTSGGVSIMGAAKRPREDAEGETPTTDNSLAKRLKPAENKPTPPIKRPPPKQ
jgi:nucleoprotein TPR